MTYQLQSHTITFDAALRDLHSQNDQVRAMAAHALGDVVDPHERARAVAVLIDALGDDIPAVRAEAALALGALETEAAVAPLGAAMGDPVPLVRQSAAIALGRLGFGSSFDAVLEILQGGAPDVRFQAATSLAEIDPTRAVPHLIQALQDDDGEVVGAAAVSLGDIGDKSAIAPLADQLQARKSARTRFDIAYGLAQLGDPRAVAVLAEYTDHKDLAWDAIEALERTGQAAAVEPLATLLATPRLHPPLALRAAAAVLKLATPGADDTTSDHAISARRQLLAGLGARKLEHRGLAVSLLGEVGASWAVNAIRALQKRRAGRKLQEEIVATLAQIQQRNPTETT